MVQAFSVLSSGGRLSAEEAATDVQKRLPCNILYFSIYSAKVFGMIKIGSLLQIGPVAVSCIGPANSYVPI